MDTPIMKILILHASAGHGHLKAGQAIEEALKRQYPDAVVELWDGFDFFPGWVKKIYVDGYVFMLKSAHILWKICYYSSDAKSTYFITRIKRRIFNGVMGRGLVNKIRQFKPDAVVATHFMPPEVVGHMIRKGKYSGKLITVVTDFLVHRFWMIKESHRFLVAAPETKALLIKEGFDPSRIHVNGIPVGKAFATSKSQAEARKALGLDENVFTVLLTTGGVGAGNVESWVKELYLHMPDIQTMVVCGTNKDLKEKLDALDRDHKRLIPLGYVNNMDQLMDACDVLVGKAGGITISESLAKKKPFLILSPVPGQETGNAEVLSKAKAAIWVRSSSAVPGHILELKNNPEIMAAMKLAMEPYSKPHSADTAARHIVDEIQG
jgi:processive 1,2-diacylglycerol beta-glucosyltransferase